MNGISEGIPNPVNPVNPVKKDPQVQGTRSEISSYLLQRAIGRELPIGFPVRLKIGRDEIRD